MGEMPDMHNMHDMGGSLHPPHRHRHRHRQAGSRPRPSHVARPASAFIPPTSTPHCIRCICGPRWVDASDLGFCFCLSGMCHRRHEPQSPVPNGWCAGRSSHPHPHPGDPPTSQVVESPIPLSTCFKQVPGGDVSSPTTAVVYPPMRTTPEKNATIILPKLFMKHD